MNMPLPSPAWPGLGLWNLYFLAKFALAWRGMLELQALPNLLLAAVLLLPLPRWAMHLRTLLALPAAAALLHAESWLPPLRRLLEQPGLLDFSPDYLLELAGRLVDWHWLGAAALLALGYRLLAPWLRFTSLSLAGLLLLGLSEVPRPVFLMPLPVSQAASATSGPAAPAAGAPAPGRAPDSATLERWLDDFHRREAARQVDFDATPALPFDLLVINICSLSWDDLRSVDLDGHRLFQRLDILFEQFNSATSYSGPAAIRLLRASCGQSSHAGLYRPAAEQCLLFDNLNRLGFASQLALNHNGRFDGFLDEVRAQGSLPEPLSAEALRRAWVAFDSSPIWSDAEVLGRWWRQRGENAAERVALFYNSITLHDGNRVVEADGSTRPAGYRERAERLLDDLDAFLDTLERSGRPVVVALVPEHGAALHGDRLQIAGMREYPSRAITHVPVGVRLIGLPVAKAAGPQRVSGPSSYLALAELVARLQAGPPAGQTRLDAAALVDGLPQTEWVAESAGGVVIDYAGQQYLRTREGGPWKPYPQRPATREVADAQR